LGFNASTKEFLEEIIQEKSLQKNKNSKQPVNSRENKKYAE